MRHKEWKMGTMVERIQLVGPSNLLNHMVKVFANTFSGVPNKGDKIRSQNLRLGSP